MWNVFFNCNATDFYSTRKYPTYLLFNPYFEAKEVTLNQHFTEPTDLYDLVSKKYIKKNCTGETSIILNPDNAVTIVCIPASAKKTKKHGKLIVDGEIVDYPNVAERRVHVDCARKYISKDWFIRQIREMSYMKMNALQIHFSENMGFRIECETDPSIVSDQYLTKTEVREILAEAKKYGINIWIYLKDVLISILVAMSIWSLTVHHLLHNIRVY